MCSTMKHVRESIDESNEIPVATLVIHGAGDMTQEQRNKIADWLDKQANALSLDGHEYAERFRAKYFR